MTVEENIAAPIREHTPLHQNVVKGMVEIKLRQVQMWGNDADQPEHAAKLPRELSGGQRKRAALARALALDPQVIFYDEPSAGLDPIVSRQIDDLMCSLGEVLGVTSLVVTHELESAFTIADRMIVLRKGDEQANEYWKPARMVAQGGPEAIMGCVQPHVIDFLHDWSYHHDSALERHGNWYREAFSP
jgi:phospholipid/cholesterol/gamma-HCH transport system ATP-binding protein